MRKFLATFALTGLLVGGPAIGALAAQELPEGCTKDRGTITCETFDGPGKNQGGVGHTTTDQTQGNLKNKSPEESQELADNECGDQHPPNAQGGPIACP